ncbi:cation diffusion facilitator family transporter [Kyrpidia sp.]|uniref:cation diffusion facilitator family transporter n=1 Tax=Kyrpidia sp. TaxID=2073077 RepID=UPI00258E6A97|nr:cation diffusion facilitator family transporter [Kyrpidia sp.]MCL6575127.1 cation diffusion facilitator family transporter [Kyrpidia sp.]
MQHHHGPESGHVHDHSIHVAQDKLKQALVLAFVVLLAEVIGGLWSNSLALLSDAVHMLTDVFALFIAWWAVRKSQSPPTGAMTFGYHRTAILAALFNAVTLIVVAVVIGTEAYRRLNQPEPVNSTVLLATAAMGVIINLYIGWGMRNASHNLNIRSAMLHVLGDAAASGGVILGGLIIMTTGWTLVDPIISILIALTVAAGAWRVTRDSCLVLMEATPPSVEFSQVAKAIQSIPGIRSLHDLHIWSLSSNRHAMSVHVVVDGCLTVAHTQRLIQEVETLAGERFGIGHVTVQIECPESPHDEEDMFALDRNWSRH